MLGVADKEATTTKIEIQNNLAGTKITLLKTYTFPTDVCG